MPLTKAVTLIVQPAKIVLSGSGALFVKETRYVPERAEICQEVPFEERTPATPEAAKAAAAKFMMKSPDVRGSFFGLPRLAA